jgi:hypothetical protein
VPDRDPDFDSELASARLDEAAAARRRRHDESAFAAMETTLASVLAGAAAGGEVVGLETGDGHRIAGRIVGLGDDIVVVASDDGRQSVVRVAAIAFVRRSVAGLVDDRAATRGSSTMLEAVAAFVGTRRLVTFHFAGGASVVGEVAWCGADVAGVRTAGDHTDEVVIYLDSLSVVTSAGASSSP